MRLEAIVVAAGKGIRLKSKISKALVNLSNSPILIHALKKLHSIFLIKNIIVVVRKKDINFVKEIIAKSKLKKIKAIIAGGRERFDSVRCGLRRLSVDTDLVLIHDAVRPFVELDSIVRCIRVANKFGAAIVGVPVKSTIKSVRGKFFIDKTLDRKKLWEIQTPQVFKKDIILRAYKRPCDSGVTDDSMLVERLGVKVGLVQGSYNNIKITTPEDLIIGEALLRNV